MLSAAANADPAPADGQATLSLSAALNGGVGGALTGGLGGGCSPRSPMRRAHIR